MPYFRKQANETLTVVHDPLQRINDLLHGIQMQPKQIKPQARKQLTATANVEGLRNVLELQLISENVIHGRR